MRATAYYQRATTPGPRWILESAAIEGIYCGERYLQQGTQERAEGDPDAPLWHREPLTMVERTGQIRTCLVAIDHRCRVSVPPSDMEVLE